MSAHEDAPGLPPFSGDSPRCLKCGNLGAVTEYHPGGRYDMVTAAPLEEYLRRRCLRCGYGWYEAILPETAATGTGDVGDGAWHSVWLYCNWRQVTRRLTIPEREHVADAVARWRTQMGTNLDHPSGLRWWEDPDESSRT